MNPDVAEDWWPEEQVSLRPEFENGGCPASVLDPVIYGVADSALLVTEVRLPDRGQAPELSPDHLPASGRGTSRLAGQISNAGQNACDHLMIISQLPHDIPKVGPDQQQLTEQTGILTSVMCRQGRAEGQAVRQQPAPGLRRAKVCLQIVQLLAKSSMRLRELTAPCHGAASILSGHQTRSLPVPAPPCLALPATSTRHGTHRINRGPGSQTSSSPILPPIQRGVPLIGYMSELDATGPPRSDHPFGYGVRGSLTDWR